MAEEDSMEESGSMTESQVSEQEAAQKESCEVPQEPGRETSPEMPQDTMQISSGTQQSADTTQGDIAKADDAAKKQPSPRGIWTWFADSFVGTYLITLILLLAGQILGGVTILLISHMDLLEPEIWQTVMLYLLFIGIWAVFVLYMLITKKNRPILRAIGTGPRGNSIKGLGIGLLTGFCMNMVCADIALMNHDISLTFDRFDPAGLLVIFIAVFIQSSAEELVCRVFMYQRLKRRYKNVWIAMVLNSVYFSVLHMTNSGVTPLSLATIAATGLAMSAQVVYMDSAWAAMGLHAAWNFTQNILLGLPNSGNVVPYSMFRLDAASDSWAYNVNFGLEGSVPALAVNLLVFAVIVIWGMRHKKQPYDVWDKSRQQAKA